MVEPEIKLKQYVFVPKKPIMSKGKIASQVCHATFMALDKQHEIDIAKWKFGGMCVIVLEVEDTEQLSNVARYLDQWGVINHLYIDEGLTEVPPMTPTALATGVIPEDKHWMFKQFELFGEKGTAQDIIDGFKPTSLDKYEIILPKRYCITNDGMGGWLE